MQFPMQAFYIIWVWIIENFSALTDIIPKMHSTSLLAKANLPTDITIRVINMPVCKFNLLLSAASLDPSCYLVQKISIVFMYYSYFHALADNAVEQ